MRFFRTGDVGIAVAVHGRGTGSPQWMFPDVPTAALLAAIAPYLDPRGEIEFVYSSVVVQLDGHLVALDAGPAPVEGAGDSPIARALGAAGLSPNDVDIAVVSHGHDDHVGGLVDDSSPTGLTFANARHYVTAAEFGHWTSGSGGPHAAGRALARVEAAGSLTLVDGEHEAVPGLTLLPSPGHTPGHLAARIDAGTERIIYVGDVLAHGVNVAHPEWNHFSDMDPETARRSRRALVERAADDDHLLLASHIPVAGRVRARGGRREFAPVEAVRAWR